MLHINAPYLLFFTSCHMCLHPPFSCSSSSLLLVARLANPLLLSCHLGELLLVHILPSSSRTAVLCCRSVRNPPCQQLQATCCTSSASQSCLCSLCGLVPLCGFPDLTVLSPDLTKVQFTPPPPSRPSLFQAPPLFLSCLHLQCKAERSPEYS